MTHPLAPSILSPAGLEFMTDRHLATLSTLTVEGAPHVVPVGFTVEVGAGSLVVRIITNGPSQKVLNVRRDGRVSVCQFEGARWLTLSGTAHIEEEPPLVADAVARYAERYRPPRENPLRVAIVFEVEHAMGSAGLLA